MKLIKLLEKTGVEIIEGGPFAYKDFGEAWVHLFDCHLSVVVTTKTHNVVMIEWFDEKNSELYSWVNKEYSDKVREETIEDVSVKSVATVDEVLNLWSLSKEEKYGSGRSTYDVAVEEGLDET